MAASPRDYLLLALALSTLALVVAWLRLAPRSRALRPDGDTTAVRPRHAALGFITNFFDTFGIGSFAPTTSAFRLLRMVPDERIPGTLNVGHTLPTIAQAFLFINAIEVDFTTLIIMISTAVAGAALGAPIVAGLSRRAVQLGMGLALLVAAGLFTLANLGFVAAGGDALALSGVKLVGAAIGNFVLGALMTLGIGIYGPSLIMISFLGMNPKAAYPIMMGSCAFLMVAAAIRFLQSGAFRQQPSVGLAVGGVPAVLIAFYVVKSLSIVTVRWVVAVVVLYTAIGLLRAALARQPAERPASVTVQP